MDKDAQQAMISEVNTEIRDIVKEEFGAMWDRLRARFEARWPGITAPANRLTGHLMRMALHDVLSFFVGHVERTIMDSSEVKGATLVSRRNFSVKHGLAVSVPPGSVASS